MTKKSIHSAGLDASVQTFMYAMAKEHLDWDLAFLGTELNAQVAVWHD